MPARDVHMLTRTRELVGDLRQCRRTVNVEFERVSAAGLRIIGTPQAFVLTTRLPAAAAWRIERMLPAQSGEAPPMVGDRGALDRVTDVLVHPVDRAAALGHRCSIGEEDGVRV